MTKLTSEASIPSLLQEMSIQEKIDLLTGKSIFTSVEMPQYGIPSVTYLDGATGVNLLQYATELSNGFHALAERKEQSSGDSAAQSDASSNESGGAFIDFMNYIIGDDPLPNSIPAYIRDMMIQLKQGIAELRPDGEDPNCFPPGMLLGATWDPNLVRGVGEAVGREASAYGVDILLGTPNTNIHRDPKNGRLFESFSEDPHLSSCMAPQMSLGVQEAGVVADVKHFAANNQETLRQGIDEAISERALREIYLPGFEAAVKVGDVGTVMSAYNSINGVPCAQNKWLLTDVLKEEWGFAGQVVSDWGAVCDQVAALNAGNDMDMPGPRGKKCLYEAVQNGSLDMNRLDDAVARTLRMILKTPAFTGNRVQKIDDAHSQQAAYTAAADGITLLKNDGILPLQKGTHIALFGRLVQRFMESGFGSAQVDTSKFTSLPVEVMRYTDFVCENTLLPDTDVAIFVAGASGQEGSDRPGMCFDAEDETMLRSGIAQAKAAGKKTVVLMNIAGPVELGEFIDNIDALVCLYFPGGQGAKACADILFGALSPSGKLPLTFPKTYRDTPTAINFPGEYGKVNYGEGIFVGYRYYDYKNIDPLFPFGFGLSYSEFSIRNVKLSSNVYENNAAQPLRVSVTVKNEGGMEAKEVVQLYVKARKSTLQRPDKELKAFRKVSLLPGEEKTVELTLTPRAFACYDTDLATWTVEPGQYELLVGNSSRNIQATAVLTVTGRNPYGCSLRSPIRFIAQHKQAVELCAEILGDVFDAGKLRSSVNYFGSTRLVDYLKKDLGVQDVQQLKVLDERLGELSD